jgi:hypothetical protein
MVAWMVVMAATNVESMAGDVNAGAVRVKPGGVNEGAAAWARGLRGEVRGWR